MGRSWVCQSCCDVKSSVRLVAPGQVASPGELVESLAEHDLRVTNVLECAKGRDLPPLEGDSPDVKARSWMARNWFDTRYALVSEIALPSALGQVRVRLYDVEELLD